MPEVVYRTMTLVCGLVASLPIGTNVGLLHLLWMLVSGQLLATPGAVIPGLDACGLSRRAVRRAWAALGQGHWTSERLLARWADQVRREERWQPRTHEGYHPVPVDVTAFWRPRLRDCMTTHYQAEAGKALPAIPVGLVGGTRLALPLAFVPAPAGDASPAAHARALLRAAVAKSREDEALVLDAGFPLALLHEEGAQRYVVRLAQNATFRRASPPPYCGRGRRPTRGTLVRARQRPHRGRVLPATPPDAETAWEEAPGVQLRAAVWTQVVPTLAGHGAPLLTVVAVYDPRYRHPWLLASPLPVTPQALHALYRDRWPVEQLPLVAKQLLGAARQFVHAPQTCQRLPVLALLAGAILAYVAATAPACPTGFWDRCPRPTAGRLRRLLAHQPFPQTFPVPARLRVKRSSTAQLPMGFWGQRHSRAAAPDDAA
jgi:Transposase DDE domain